MICQNRACGFPNRYANALAIKQTIGQFDGKFHHRTWQWINFIFCRKRVYWYKSGRRKYERRVKRAFGNSEGVIPFDFGGQGVMFSTDRLASRFGLGSTSCATFCTLGWRNTLDRRSGCRRRSATDKILEQGS